MALDAHHWSSDQAATCRARSGRSHRVTAHPSGTPRPARPPITIRSCRYHFYDTHDGNLCLRRTRHDILQDAHLRLRDELEARNRQALDHGGSTPPYEQESAPKDIDKN